MRAITGDDRQLTIEGDRLHPANAGDLCDRVCALDDMASLDGRLLHPMVNGRRMDWDRALARIARQLTGVLARHGPGSVALHVGGGLLTEDYYVANKLMKGFLGSAHIQTPWIGTAGAAQRAAFGEDVMPAAFEDIDRADIILLTDADIIDAHPVLFERVMAARADRGARIILLGAADGVPEVDLCLPIMPGSAPLMIAGLLRHCHDSGATDADWLAGHVDVPSGFWNQLATGRDIWSVARGCGIAPGAIRDFYDVVAGCDRLVTIFGDGAALGAAVINLHLATGRIGRPGAAPFALSAAANGMGAREVGCIAPYLAAHRGFTPDALASVGRFWGARHLADAPGLAGEALLQAMRDGHVRALWSIGGATDAWLDAARAAVPFSIRATDRADAQDQGWSVLLPSAAWVEKDGTLTGMDRLISRQRRLFPLPDDARPDWWMLTRVGQAMGWRDAFHYEHAADVYREHVRLTAYHNAGARLLNLKRHAPISNPAYAELTPWRWGETPFDEGVFPTPDGRARLVPMPDQDALAIP